MLRVPQIQASPFLKHQSVLLDNKTGTRFSVFGDLTRSNDNIKTFFDLFALAAEKFGNKKCLGIRKSFEESITWHSYLEVYQEIRLLGSALVKLIGEDQNKIIGIYGRNCPQWVCTHFACAAYGLISVPVYDTLGQEAMAHILKETNMKIAVCYTAEKGQRLLQTNGSQLETVIVIHVAGDDSLQKYARDDQKARGNFISYTVLLKKEALSQNLLPLPVIQPFQLHEICYTSGSTGFPKGVMVTHEKSIKSAMVVREILDDYVGGQEDNTHLSFLPLAHIFEQMNIAFAIDIGASIAFLTEDITGLIKDMKTYSPTYIMAVPRLLTRFYTEGTRLLRSNPVTRHWLSSTISRKLEEQKRGTYCPSGILDWLCFSKLRTMLGGRVKFIACGSAPISSDVCRFIQVAMSCPLIEGYSSTESVTIVSRTLPGDITFGHVGSLTYGTQIKLVDVPDMDLLVSRDKMGEILVKTVSQTDGYYNNKELTKELIQDDGFIKTGDIGYWTLEGALKIVDRCKNAFKLAQGEFVAPEKIEQIYSTSSLVANVLVEGSSMNTFAVAVVAPNMLQLRKCLLSMVSSSASVKLQKKTPNFEDIPDEELCQNDFAKQVLLQDLQRLGAEKKLCGFEQCKAIHLTPTQFTVENGFLTPTMKMNRPIIRKAYAEAIKQIYVEYDLKQRL